MNIQPAIAPPAGIVIKTSSPVSSPEATAAATETSGAGPAESYTPEAEGESRLSAAFRGGVRKGVAWGNVAEKPLGGAAALGMAAAGGLALAFGGAVVGGIIGGGFGPAVAAVARDGAWNFVKGSFSNVGTAIQWGSTAGAVVGLAGGVMMGKSVGDTVARTTAFVPGFVAGGVQGFLKPGSVPAPEHKEKKAPEHRSELRGPFRTEAKVLSGMGILSGAVGGFVGGAALTAAGSLVADAASGNFSFSNFLNQVGTQALIGGAVGGTVLAAVGGYGGEGIARASQWTYDKTIGKATAGQPSIGERIAKKEAELNVRQGTLTEKAEQIGQQAVAYRGEHQAQSEQLKGREDKMASDESRVSSDLATIDGRIEGNAQSSFQGRAATADSQLDARGPHGVIGQRGSLQQWDQKLTGWQGQLDGFRGELKSWERQLDAKIDRDAAAIFGEERQPIDAHFAGLKSELDAFEKKLDAYESDIKARIQARYQSGIQAEKPGVEKELRLANQERSQAQQDKDLAAGTRQTAASRHSMAQESVTSAQDRLKSAQDQGDALQTRFSRLNSRIADLQSQLNSCRLS